MMLEKLVIVAIGSFSVIGYIIAISSMYTFSKYIRAGQKKNLGKKIGTILFIFLLSTLLFKLSTKIQEEGIEFINQAFEWIVYCFSVTFILISAVSTFLSSTILKAKKYEIDNYLMLGGTILISYILGVFLIFLLSDEKNLMWTGLLFFSVVIVQFLFLNGEYVLKRYLIEKGIEVKDSVLGEYPVFFKELLSDTFNLKDVQSIQKNDIETGSDDSETKKNKIKFDKFFYDLAFTIFTMTLGIILILIKTEVHVSLFG